MKAPTQCPTREEARKETAAKPAVHRARRGDRMPLVTPADSRGADV